MFCIQIIIVIGAAGQEGEQNGPNDGRKREILHVELERGNVGHTMFAQVGHVVK